MDVGFQPTSVNTEVGLVGGVDLIRACSVAQQEGAAYGPAAWVCSVPLACFGA